jgi:hypothetical protein
MAKGKPQMQRKKDTCVCGCGRKLVPGETGQNFATPACVLRTMQKHPGLAAAFGEDLQAAIDVYEGQPKPGTEE